jgi:predicted transglutaminase-like cysteine proteinase
MTTRTQKTNAQVCNERNARTLKVRNRMNKALGLLIKAQDEMRVLLDEVNADIKETNNWYLTGDLSHYFAEVSDIISTDKGECGLLPFVNNLTKEIEASKGVSRKPTQEQIAKALKKAYR